MTISAILPIKHKKTVLSTNTGAILKSTRFLRDETGKYNFDVFRLKLAFTDNICPEDMEAVRPIINIMLNQSTNKAWSF